VRNVGGEDVGGRLRRPAKDISLRDIPRWVKIRDARRAGEEA
jgi:DNA-binding IscR family transcriptional regulator